jgi:NADH-quinone oxidoreductase subunit L
MDPLPILLVLIPALPLAAALVTAALGKRVLRQWSHIPVVTALALAFLASALLMALIPSEARPTGKAENRIGYERIVPLWTWVHVADAYPALERASAVRSLSLRGIHPSSTGDGASPFAEGGMTTSRDFQISIVLRADALTAVMLVTVTLVSMLVAIYSIGYMHGDPGYWRFFTYIGLFVFSMTMLVSASNFVLLYAFWEAVGLCSYLLIGFWFQKPEAAAAGKKAFLVNRVGDFGFALGVFLIWTTYGTLDFHDTLGVNVGPNSQSLIPNPSVVDVGVLGQTRLAAGPAAYHAGSGVATAICLLLMLGACGKSAQIPLHIWLPDAMEGPTPVSALIHAATMVTAGVYMVARCMPLYFASPDALRVVAGIGGATALTAAIIAVTQTDLKRILAYSTISQLGYMFLGLGVGTLAGVSAGMFHLVTHAFFKGLLFLGAGSVMHAMGGVIDIRRLGGLRRILPVTHAMFLVGCLALAGFPLLSGFFSKDEILTAAFQRADRLYLLLYAVGLLTAFLTAFYAFRAYFLTFHGEERVPHEAGHHAHESPRVMTWPLAVLAVFSAGLGAYCALSGQLERFLEQAPSLAYLSSAESAAEASGHWTVAITSSAIALAGIGLAWFLYVGSKQYVAPLTRAMDSVGLYRLSTGKFFFDWAYNILVVWPLEGIARLSASFDRGVVDGLVNFVGAVPPALGGVLRSLQTGLVQFYALGMLLGVLVLLWALLL